MSYEEISDEELEEIRRRKLLELQARLEEERRRRELLEKREAQKQIILRRILTPKARERLNNIKLVKPELAAALEEQLIVLANSGRIEVPITDETLKSILAEIASRTTREFRFKIREK